MINGWTDRLARHWRPAVVVFWLIVCAWFLYQRWAAIHGFALGDTDDNMRIMQVRAWLAGQGWFDLRQYRLNPPYGANIHWSRIVDLPLAGIKLALAPVIGGATAERAAVAIAPLLPMLVAMFAVAAAARRLLSPAAFILALLVLVCGPSLRGMWSPLRIDHHGWQLAMLSLVALGLIDRNRLRGGITVGLATATSLAIGLEMLIYLAAAGALIGLMWPRDREEAPRLFAYGASLAAGTGFLYLLFTSYANRAPVCDALSPVWLSMMILAGIMCMLLARLTPASLWVRIAAAGIAAGGLAAAYAFAWPHCLSRLEGTSPELEQMWLNRVREAMPLYKHGWRIALNTLILPIAGLIGYALMIWRTRRDPAEWPRWAALGLLALLPCLLLLWQTRAGAASQMLAIPGATALIWSVLLWLWVGRSVLGRIAGLAAFAAVLTAIGMQFAGRIVPENKPTAGRVAVRQAGARCPSMRALKPVALQPKGTILTHVDLGPRLIAVTHHNALAGPYHRNGGAILSIMRAFRGTPEAALRTVQQRGIDYVLICPNISESTVYRADAPNGFYMQLVRGKVPAWLEAVPLPAGSPYRMWRVRR